MGHHFLANILYYNLKHYFKCKLCRIETDLCVFFVCGSAAFLCHKSSSISCFALFGTLSADLHETLNEADR